MYRSYPVTLPGKYPLLWLRMDVIGELRAHSKGKSRIMFARTSNSRCALRLWIVALIVVLIVSSALGFPVSVQGAKADESLVTIMPLGDSITAAFTGHTSYRYWLWKKLVKEKFNVDFVGSQYGVIGGPPLYSDFDQDHEGHFAYTADDLLLNVGSFVSAYRPQIILLHIGTNDIFQGHDNATTINTIGQTIDAIRRNDPNPIILLAQVIPLAGKLAQTRDFNSRIPRLAREKSTRNSPVVVVNQWAGFDLNIDTYDGVHPNQKGEQKMANHWFGKLRHYLHHKDGSKNASVEVPTVPPVKLAPTFVPSKK